MTRVALVLSLFVIGMAAIPAGAATITVNNPTGGTGISGDCTLAEAIQAANTDTAVDACAAGSGADLIVLPECLLSIMVPDHTDPTDGPIGMPDITTDITIRGQGSFSSAISNATDGVVAFSLFRVAVGGKLRLEDLRLTSGFNLSGGAVVVRGILETSFVDLDNNQSTDVAGGGGAMTILPGGSATIDQTFLSSNFAAQQGGAIFSRGTLVVTNSTFSGNNSGFSGGAIEGRAGTGTISDSAFFGNIADAFGGALHFHAPATLNVSMTDFFNNTAGIADLPQNGGGAIEGDAMMRITECLFDGNSAISGLNRAEGGAVRVIGADLQITRSTFRGNVAIPGSTGVGVGGAVAVLGFPPQPTIITNSTFSANEARGTGGGGGAFFFDNNGASAVMNNLTIVQNTATLGATGGGLHLTASANMVRIRNSIFALNSATNGFDCFTAPAVSLLSNGHNILGDSTGCVFTAAAGDQVGGGAMPPIDPRVDALRDRGGFAPVHGLLTGSPAIDLGNPGAPGTGGDTCEATDQPGTTRPVGTRCDIGAFEGVIAQANLVVLKTASASPVQVGTPFDYFINVMNVGPEPATNVVVTDVLNSALTFNNIMTTQGSCTGTLFISCTLGTLPVDGSATITINVSANAAGSIFNSATATLNEEDPIPGNNSGFVSVTAQLNGDLRLVGSAASLIARGNDLTYNFSVTNLGGVDATSVVLTQTLPSGVIFKSFVAPGGSCGETGGVVTCTLGTRAAGAVVNVQIVVTVPSTLPVDTVLSSTASISAAETDPFTMNNTATNTTTVRGNVNLTITKADSPDPVSLDSNVTFTITLSNSGPDTARNVVVSDFLSPELAFVSSMSTVGSCSGTSLVTCSLGDLGSGASATITIVATATVVCDFTNSAIVSTTDLNSGMSFATTSTMVVAAPGGPDLVVVMTDTPDPVTVGDTLVYAIDLSVVNGSATFAPVVVTDVLPATVTFNPAQSTNICTEMAGTVTCNVPGVNDSATTSIMIAVTVNAPGTIFNTITAVPTPADANTANNTAMVTTTALAPASADLGIVKTGPATVLNGGNVSYTLSVMNMGPDAAAGVMVTDPLSAEATLVSAIPSQGTCSGTTTITCDLGSLNSGAGASVTITVTAATTSPPSQLNNQAAVTAATPDPDSSNNSSNILSTDILPRSDLSAAITDSPDPVAVGATLTYTATLVNNGPDLHTGRVNFGVILSAGVTVLTSSPGCTQTSPNIFDCATGDLPPNQPIDHVFTVTPNTPGTITATASAGSSSFDPINANNNATTTTTVIALADLGLTKTGPAGAVNVGANITYTLTVSNPGNNAATGVTLTDTLPAGVSFVSATPSQGSCTGTATVTCSIGTMNASSTVTVTLVAMAGAAAAPMVTNTASVTLAETDPNVANNTASATTAVTPIINLSLTKAASPSPVVINNNLSYTMTVSNTGPSPATGVTLTDPLPSGPAFVSAMASQGSCSGTATVTCALGTINSGASATVTIVIRPTVAGTLTNTASVTGVETDSDPANNSATASTTVNSVPFTIGTAGGTGSSQSIDSGQTATFTLTITPNFAPLVVSFNCANLPPESTCFFTPPGLVFNDTSPQTVTMTVSTTICIETPPRPQSPWNRFDPRSLLPLLALLTGLLWLALRRGEPRMAVSRALPAVLLVCALLAMAGCAGGPNGSELRRGLTGTIPGTYAITVNATSASGASSQTVSTQVTLVVRQ